MNPIVSPRDPQAAPAVRRPRGHWLDQTLDLLYIAVAALGLGCGVGIAYGWPAGLAVLVAVDRRLRSASPDSIGSASIATNAGAATALPDTPR